MPISAPSCPRGRWWYRCWRGEAAVEGNREVMGATDPADAAPGTIRAEFGESIQANSVHGSDSAENAAQEIAFFFTEHEIVG